MLQLERPLAVLLCDIDHFKRINDSHGHLVGDAVLGEIAGRLRNAVRQDDAIGRYGGEEFLILLAGCDERTLQERAEQVCVKVSEKAIDTEGDAIFATVSIGAIAVNSDNDSVAAQNILRRVDEALYLAKENGRNRVMTATL